MKAVIDMKRLMALSLLVFASAVCPAQKPELVVQTGHAEQIYKTSISPDKNLLASVDTTGNVLIWDVQTGKQLRKLSCLEKSFEIAFDSNTSLVGVNQEGEVRFCNVIDGQILSSLQNPGHGKTFLSQDGKYLASASSESIEVLNLQTKEKVKLNEKIEKSLLTFSSDGQFVAVSDGDSNHDTSLCKSLKTVCPEFSDDAITLKVWNIKNKSAKTLVIPESKIPQLDKGNFPKYEDEFKKHIANGMKFEITVSDKITSLSFNCDASVLAIGRMTTATINFNGPLGGRFYILSFRHTISNWNSDNGNRLESFTTGNSSSGTGGINSLGFTSDNKYLISGSGDGSIRFWNPSNGKEIKRLGKYDQPSRIELNNDGTLLVRSSIGNSLEIWDLTQEKESVEFKQGVKPISSLKFSPDGKTLVVGFINEGVAYKTLKLLDLVSGTTLKTFADKIENNDSIVFSLEFSPDGSKFASASGNLIRIWDVKSGNELEPFKGHTGRINLVAFSPDGNSLASGSSDGTFRVWDVNSRKEIINQSIDQDKSFKKFSRPEVLSVAFSKDGKTLVVGNANGRVLFWDLERNAKKKTFLPKEKFPAWAVAFDTEEKTLLSGSDDYVIRQWDIESGQQKESLPENDETLQKLAQTAPKLLEKFCLATTNGKIVPEKTDDGKIRLRNSENWKIVGEIIALDKDDWVVVTPDGFFDGSPNGWNQLIWRLDNNTFNWVPIEAFFNEFYYPGLLSEIMAGKKPRPPRKELSAVDIRQPQVRITRVGGQAVIQNTFGQSGTMTDPVRDRKVEVTLEITDNVKVPSRPAHPKTSGAQDVRLFRNGSLVKLWLGDAFAKESQCQQLPAQEPLAPRRSVCTVGMPIVAGKNRLAAYAFNIDNVKSGDATLTITGADGLKRRGVAYLLAVGVNQYANSHYNLKYALADAQDFAEELKRQQTKLGNYERFEVTSLKDKDATKANILKLLTDLPAKIQPEDAVVIYFAGHGTAQGNRFYLIPHDLGYTGNPKRLDDAGLQSILRHSISDEELERAIEGIDAGQLLLVIDACNSGQALEAEEKRRGPMNSKGLAQLAYEKGMYILTAAQSYQAALEASKLGHGYLTYALVEEGLKTPAADVEPKDNQLLLREWLDYATNRVPQMQQEAIERGARGLGLEVIFVEGDEKIKDPNKRNLQRPRVFYRRETETMPFVVAKP